MLLNFLHPHNMKQKIENIKYDRHIAIIKQIIIQDMYRRIVV
jgi:hypothetical protein